MCRYVPTRPCRLYPAHRRSRVCGLPTAKKRTSTEGRLTSRQTAAQVYSGASLHRRLASPSFQPSRNVLPCCFCNFPTGSLHSTGCVAVVRARYGHAWHVQRHRRWRRRRRRRRHHRPRSSHLRVVHFRQMSLSLTRTTRVPHTWWRQSFARFSHTLLPTYASFCSHRRQSGCGLACCYVSACC